MNHYAVGRCRKFNATSSPWIWDWASKKNRRLARLRETRPAEEKPAEDSSAQRYSIFHYRSFFSRAKVSSRTRHSCVKENSRQTPTFRRKSSSLPNETESWLAVLNVNLSVEKIFEQIFQWYAVWYLHTAIFFLWFLLLLLPSRISQLQAVLSVSRLTFCLPLKAYLELVVLASVWRVNVFLKLRGD